MSDPDNVRPESGESGIPSDRPTAWDRLRRNPLTLLGLFLVAVLALSALSAPWLPLPDPAATDVANRLQPPLSPGHPLGTDPLGRDMLSRILWGMRVSLAVGIAATAAAALFGALVGLVAGFFGGRTDTILMRGIDMLMAFPYLLLALAIVAALGPGLLNALYAIAVVNIPFFARNVRGATVGLVRLEFVDAARLSGLNSARILLMEILPNVLPVIVVTVSTTVGWMILETAGLSFLGLGAQPPRADLGAMLGEGRKLIIAAPHVATVPGVAIFLLVMGINLVGDGLRDVLDPRLSSGELLRPLPRTEIRRENLPAAKESEKKGESPLLSVTGLTTRFFTGGEVYRAVEDVSFVLRSGDRLGVVGESGSGKSVTALSLLGLAPSPPGCVVGGRVEFRGRDLLDIPLSDLRNIRGNRIGMIFQDPLGALNPLMPVGDQIAEAIRVHGKANRTEARRRAVEWMERVRIARVRERAENRPHELSGGMRQRIGIAMALANGPDLVIADEPTTALDVTVQAGMLRLLDDLRREQGAALLFITHDFALVEQVCERVTVMYAGRVVETGPAADVLESPLHPYTRRLIDCVPVPGDPDRKIRPIPGMAPPANRLPPGCAFAPRCDRVIDDCRRGEIPLDRFGEDRAARCIRAGEWAS